MLDGVGIKDVFTVIVAIQDKLLFDMQSIYFKFNYYN